MLPERGSDVTSANHSLSFSETFIINARMIHEARFRIQHDTSDTIAKTHAVAINVLDAFQGGGSTCCPSDSRTDNVEYQDYLTITFKKHSVKLGFQVENERHHNLSAGNFNGTYTFSTINLYSQVLNGTLVPSDPNNPNSPLAPARPTQFTLNTGNPLLRYSQWESSWFAQDDIRYKDNLTFSFGFRHEFQAHLQDKLNFAPRVGVAWSPFKNRKTTIRAGGGVFFNRLSAGTYGNVLRYNNQLQQSITIRNPIYLNPLPAICRNSA